MNIERLMQRIRLGEDSMLEMKQVMIRGGGKVIEPHPDGLSDELAALGNASGGTLILGVDEKPGRSPAFRWSTWIGWRRG